MGRGLQEEFYLIPSSPARFLFFSIIFIIRVRSVRLGSLDFGFAIEREIRKRISTLRSLFLDFLFTENSFANPFSDFPIDR